MGFAIKTEKGFIKKVSTYYNSVDFVGSMDKASVCNHRDDAESIAHIAEMISGVQCEIVER